MQEHLLLLLNLCSLALAWYACPFTDNSLNKTISGNVTIQAECTFLTSPLEWKGFNPNTFDGAFYNRTRTIPVMNIHVKRLFFSKLSPQGNSSGKHFINYWLLNGGGGSQVGMESFGISMLKQISMNNYHLTYPNTYPIMYLFQYRGAGMSTPSIHCHTARTWPDCATELINTTVPSSRDESLRVINAMSNQHIAQDLQYQVQYAMNETQSTAETSTYIYGLSQGTGIIEHYLTIQSIDSNLQIIDGVILDGVMSVKESDTGSNQFKFHNERFYMYLAKCQQDSACSKTFNAVSGSDQDIIIVTLRLQMLFLTNKTNPLCTHQVGLTDWPLFILIANQGIETVSARPITAILIARIYRCSVEDQRVLSKALPIMINLVNEYGPGTLIDPPEAYPADGSVLSIVTIWSDYIGKTLTESVKDNAEFYNDLCIRIDVSYQIYIASAGLLPLCNDTQVSKYNYVLSRDFKDILYSRNPLYWGQLQVNPRIFRPRQGGALLFNGDLDYNSPLVTAEQFQEFLRMQEIPTKLVAMKGLTHVTAPQSYTKSAGFQSPSCTEQIIAQFLYRKELNVSLSNLDDRCNSEQTLIGIDWFYQDATVNKTLYDLFGGTTTNYWGVSIDNQPDKLPTPF
ncbi:unnamed protein product [Adineta ricciae]|uniref:Peptidase S33 tripeptidyl aminopeptidase-like C-terminal domain-containing protein n=1 Tax=Adineta ricciae TaxID=249248 RepID=A0A816AV79_ADIRI|nr:unnamed protein product [Adineta ricciae]